MYNRSMVIHQEYGDTSVLLTTASGAAEPPVRQQSAPVGQQSPPVGQQSPPADDTNQQKL